MSLTDDETRELARLQAKAREGNTPKDDGDDKEMCTLHHANGHSVTVPIDSDIARDFLKRELGIEIDKPAKDADKEIKGLEGGK